MIMILNNRILRFVALAAILSMTACGGNDKSSTDPDPTTPTEETTKINGTEIKTGNNLDGLVSDSSTGKGLSGIPVTDGFTFTTTDANGVYQMEANRYCRKVYITLPAGYKVPTSSSSPSIPQFYSTTSINRQVVNRNDFKLEPLTSDETNFTLLMIGDPQCKTDAQVDRYVNETIVDIKNTLNSNQSSGKYKNAYAMTLGDITFDNVAEWGNMTASMSKVPLAAGGYLPIFQCIGNHDHDASTSSDFNATQNFFDHFGPTDYSFNRGKAHIIVMDNIEVTSSTGSTWEYDGGFTSAQLKWLTQDINLVDGKSDKLVLLCCHIPFRGGASSGGASVNTDKNYKAVLDLLAQFKEAHLMIGHTHYYQNWIHSEKSNGGLPIYEHIHGAACGSWWSCNSTVTGAPNGYSIYEIEGNQISNWVAKGTNHGSNFQMRVYDGNQIYKGSRSYSLNWYTASQVAGASSITVRGNSSTKNCFVAEVFNDDDTYWTVEMYKDGAKVGNFTRLADGSSCNIAAASYFFNELGKNTTTWSSTTASHYWYFKPSSGNPSAETGWTVRATQTIPSTGKTNVYECNTLTTDISSSTF